MWNYLITVDGVCPRICWLLKKTHRAFQYLQRALISLQLASILCPISVQTTLEQPYHYHTAQEKHFLDSVPFCMLFFFCTPVLFWTLCPLYKTPTGVPNDLLYLVSWLHDSKCCHMVGARATFFFNTVLSCENNVKENSIVAVKVWWNKW